MVIFVIVLLQLIFEAWPVSSSGHVLLFELSMRIFRGIDFEEIMPKCFDHFLHIPTVLILMVVFFNDWFNPFKCLARCLGFFKSDQGVTKKNLFRAKKLWGILLKIIGLVFITVVIAFIFYFIKEEYLNHVLSFRQQTFFLLLCFCIGMCLLFSLKFLPSNQVIEIFDTRKAIIIGFAQCVPLLFPGISRFGITYVVGRWLNLSSRRAIQISFLIQFPLIFAGSLRGIYFLFKESAAINLFSWQVNLSLVLGTIISFFFLKFAKKLALSDRFWFFGFYLIVPIAYLIIFLL